MTSRLHAMLTPEMIDRFECDVRALLKTNAELREQAREEIVATLKKGAIDDLNRPPVKNKGIM